jgi:hypothetical protein
MKSQTKECTYQPRIVTELDEAVERVFEDTSGISTEGRADFDVVKRNQQHSEKGKTKYSFPAYSLK